VAIDSWLVPIILAKLGSIGFGRRPTEVRNAAIGSMVPGPIRRGMLGAGGHARGGHSTITNLGAGQSSDV
jgi:hypothetical protein